MPVFKLGTFLRWKTEPTEVYLCTDSGYKYVEGKYPMMLGSTFGLGSFWYDVNRWEPVTDEFEHWVYEVKYGQTADTTGG